MHNSCVLLLLVFVCSVSGRSKYVSISLDAKWMSTPYLLESSEYISKDRSESFWAFVNDISHADPTQISEASDEDYYSFVLQHVAKYVSPIQLNLFQLSLSVRENSPLVEMYNQMARDVGPPDGCDAFITIGHKKTCDHTKIEAWVQKAKSLDFPPTTLYKFDHIYPGSDDSSIIVILYAELGTDNFAKFHETLKQLSHDGKLRYVLRHFVQTPSDSKVRLSGYGVELDIKSTEYKAKDDTKVTEEKTDEGEDEDDDELEGFMFSQLREKYPDLKTELKDFRTHLMDSATELTPLKAWQYQDLSYQAAQRVLSQDGPAGLTALRDVSQNFPILARSLIKLKVDGNMKKEIKLNRQEFEQRYGLSEGDSAFYINGLPIETDTYDMSTILDLLRAESTLMEGLFTLGINGTAMSELLKVDISPKDNYAVDIRHSAVQYLNNLETDTMYRQWPSTIQDLLRPQFPGMLRHVAKNIFNLIFIADPTDSASKELLKMAETFHIHSAPIRIGVVLVSKAGRDVNPMTDPSVAMSRAFCYTMMDAKASRALSFITDLYDMEHPELTADVIIEEFKRQNPDEDIDNVFGDNDEYDDCRKLSNDFIEQTGLGDFPQVLMNGASLPKDSLNEERFEEAVVTAILEATPAVQKAVYHGELTDKMDIMDWLMEQDHVLRRLNSRVLSPSKQYLDYSQNLDESIYNDPGVFSTLNNADMTSVITGNMKYLYKKAEEESTPGVTIWLVVDLETLQGRQLLSSSLKRLKSSVDLRIGIIFNPSTLAQDNIINHAVYVALRDVDVNYAKNIINKIMRDENVAGLRDGSVKLRDLVVHGMDTNAYITAVKTMSNSYLQVHQTFVQNVLKFTSGQRGLVANGKVIGPFGEQEDFTTEDLDLLEKFTVKSTVKTIKSRLVSLGYRTDLSDLVMKVSSLLSSRSNGDKRTELKFHADQHSVLKIPGDPDQPAYTVDVILDPASIAAQKISPILSVLREAVNMDIRIFMNCREQLSDLPIKSFYRYVLEPQPTFKNGIQNAGPVAKFVDIPHKSLLTLKMNAPEGWLVESVRSPYDLDNILLDEVEHGVVAEFELEHLLLEGHCYDAGSGQPPRGLQFTLGTNSSPNIVDTIVMANLGYFQLKAYPGTWTLKLRDGRSHDIYDIVSHEHTDTPPNSTDVIVVMNSFKSRTVRMKVEKKAGMRHEDLLKDDTKDETMGLWDTFSSSFVGGSSKSAGEDDNQTLNIFSVASGHLYERFLRIMMLSVMKQTKSNVKFWFLKNFLSPTFKNFIPHMAKKYGFQYELVQYKWPRWLHQQTVKQRIIWGYKILFLDVLFPLDVKKFIFVDADQMVRTDLKELFDLDLGGAPYGYTPFCDSRSEMDGFRFWNSGYWRSHMGGRKYHISALYVVDLQKFRHIAAGDRLRGQYQGLSQDPNSLSNLDQDLPNNMIHQVAIKSLPQDWLWCETWCSDASKATAKTIDLCNNPLTKEPKLQAAMRILPEWKHYDYEIKLLWDSVYNTDTAANTEYEIPTQKQDEEKKPIKEEL